MDRRHGFQALGQPEPHAVAAVDAPASQPRGHAIGPVHELGVALPPAMLVLDGGVVGPPPRGLIRALGLRWRPSMVITYPRTWSSLGLSEKQTIDVLVLDHRAGQSQEQTAMANRIGVVVPRGDLDLARVERSNVSDRSKTVSPWCDAMALSRATGSARVAGKSDLPTRGMMAITSGTPATRHSAAIASIVLSYSPSKTAAAYA